MKTKDFNEIDLSQRTANQVSREFATKSFARQTERNDEQHPTNVRSARVQTKLYIAWGSKRKLKPIRYGAGDRGMDGCTEKAVWGSKRILKCQSTKTIRGETQVRNLLLRRVVPYPFLSIKPCELMSWNDI